LVGLFLCVHFHILHTQPNVFLHILLHPKNYSFSRWMVSCVTFYKMLFCKGVIMWGGEILTSTKWEQELECKLFFSRIQKTLYCNLVLYIARRCHGNSSYVNATSIINLFSFPRLWIMLHDVKSIQSRNILLP